MGVPHVDFHPGARGSLVGAEYHCIHGPNQKTVFKVLGCKAPSEITMQIEFPFVGTVWRTDRAEAEGPSTTRVDTAISWKTSGIKGHWVWLPSLGIPGLPETWGFAPPGTLDSTLFGFPGANGNYTNGQTSSLLGMSANCPPGANANRQTDHGIQSGCV